MSGHGQENYVNWGKDVSVNTNWPRLGMSTLIQSVKMFKSKSTQQLYRVSAPLADPAPDLDNTTKVE